MCDIATTKNEPMKVFILPGREPKDDVGEQIFREHGCLIEKFDDHWEVIFPPGTTREPINKTIRSQFVLPDGFVVQEISLKESGKSVLGYDEKQSTAAVKELLTWSLSLSMGLVIDGEQIKKRDVLITTLQRQLEGDS